MPSLSGTDNAGSLEHALQIAAEAHAGQTDKNGTTYIRHPLRVMRSMSSEEARIVAVLHDVVEDSEWSLSQLRQAGFEASILEALDKLTKRDDESYDEFIDRTASDPIAATVKRADIEDNMDVTRLDEFGHEAADRLEKYHRAWQRLDGSAEVTSGGV